MHSKYAPTHDSFIQHKLGYLVEECGEVMAAAGKSIRWGLDSVNPELPPEQQETNAQWLKREFRDLKYAIHLMESHFSEIEKLEQAIEATKENSDAVSIDSLRDALIPFAKCTINWAKGYTCFSVDPGKYKDLIPCAGCKAGKMLALTQPKQVQGG